MSNVYHITHRLPALTAKDMEPTREKLAVQLVQSGRLRLRLDTERNFITHSTGARDVCFSKRELTDPAFWPETYQRLADLLPGSAGQDGIMALHAQCMQQLHLKDAISQELELKCARVLVQSCEPIVMQMALAERIEIFVSFSHSIGDLMPVHFWETHGLNSGMQSLSGDGKAVYVSCGGNPFFDGEDDQKRYTTDGLPALARMMVIAGQELGHYADIFRNAEGQTISRHSATLAPLRAKDNVYRAWADDQASCAALEAALAASPIKVTIRREEAVSFFYERKRWVMWLFALARRALAHRTLRAHAKRANLPFITHFPKTTLGGKALPITSYSPRAISATISPPSPMSICATISAKKRRSPA